MADHTEFVFSFRSPYSWMAAQCVLPRFPPEMEIRWLPFYPLPSFANFPPPIESKFRYLIRDVTRLTKHYGLTLKWPSADDLEWAIPHSAFLHAEAEGRGAPFAREVYAARFSRGENISDATVLARAAEATELDPETIVGAALDEAAQAALTVGIRENFEDRDIFGVPTLILPRGSRFWGHDRIEWALREGLILA